MLFIYVYDTRTRDYFLT